MSWRAEVDGSVHLRICTFRGAFSQAADDFCQVGSGVADQGVGGGIPELVDGFNAIVGVEAGEEGDGGTVECGTWDLYVWKNEGRRRRKVMWRG